MSYFPAIRHSNWANVENGLRIGVKIKAREIKLLSRNQDFLKIFSTIRKEIESLIICLLILGKNFQFCFDFVARVS